MVDDIHADGIVFIQGDGDFHLGADAVYVGDQDGLVISFKFVQPAEEPDSPQDLRAEGGLGHLADDFFFRPFRAGIDIYPAPTA